MPPSNLSRAARRASQRGRTSAATDIVRLRTDAGISRAELSRGSGVDPSYLGRIERGETSPSLDTYSQLAVALGADLSVRLYPNTGPAIRDRHQAKIAEAMIGILHPRWHPYLEIAVRRPSRGWIDAGLHDARSRIMVATEIQSELRRLEQLIRWSREKAASLESWEGWSALGDGSSVSQLLVVRDTRTTRAVAREFRRILQAAFPAHPDDALASLIGVEPWPGPALLWATGGRAQSQAIRFIARR